ncbi:proton-coupled folate transporter-like [Harmonia axyridis]|uniref:proton-coupled folate transporter-like n=1 Tax=Harmonia axyridis TaxID=115357 RepID=UPI001E2775AF|nr:proton-coupled folate transporter-like [Harmonia axyridis]XP_045465634.1 proton-coupled folate transporter-like [Harmonia axyridis]
MAIMAESNKEENKNMEIKKEATSIDKEKKQEKQRTESITSKWKKKYRLIIDNVTVEPMLALYIIPSVFASLATQNLSLEKACRVNLNYPTYVCDALSARETSNYTKEENAVQELVASMSVWKTMLQSALPAFLIMFIGSWSDRWGRRKPCMLLPIIGEFSTVIGLLICSYFFYELPMEVNGIVEGLFPALTGGWFTMFMGVFSFMGDVTTVERRTLRIGIVNVICSLGIPIGLALSGVMYKKIGFYGVFSSSAIMYIIALYYGVTTIKEKEKVNLPVLDDKPLAFVRDFFNVKHLYYTFEVAFKRGENQRRKKVILLMLVVMVVIGPMHGEMAVTYLFTRYRFNWDEVDYSIFSTYCMVTNLIGTSISVGVFSHMMKIDDAIVGIYSSISKILSSFVYGFAKTSFVFYLGAIVEILNGTSFIAMRSIASKLVSSEELGKVNSLFGACEALMPLIYGPMYSGTYAATLNIMPGLFFILGGILTIPAVIIFGWMYVQNRKTLKANETKDLEVANQPEESALKDVILNSAATKVQIGSPILDAKSQNEISEKEGVTNPAFEGENH